MAGKPARGWQTKLAKADDQIRGEDLLGQVAAIIVIIRKK